MEVNNKKIIITGGANGIGKELTKQLISKGAYVSALDINIDNLNKLKEELNTDKLSTYVVDVSNTDSINDFKIKYFEEQKYVDILINNAGIVQPFLAVNELKDEDIKRVMNVNFFGVVNLTRAMLENMLNRDEAYIINISSMGGFFPFPKQSIYGASKAATKLFTEGLYAELLDTKVKVMVVFPGAISTDILKNSNVSVTTTKENSSYKMTSPEDTASQIIKGINKNKFKLYIGSDSKFMNFLYKMNSKSAINYINKKMKDLN